MSTLAERTQQYLDSRQITLEPSPHAYEGEADYWVMFNWATAMTDGGLSNSAIVGLSDRSLAQISPLVLYHALSRLLANDEWFLMDVMRPTLAAVEMFPPVDVIHAQLCFDLCCAILDQLEPDEELSQDEIEWWASVGSPVRPSVREQVILLKQLCTLS